MPLKERLERLRLRKQNVKGSKEAVSRAINVVGNVPQPGHDISASHEEKDKLREGILSGLARKESVLEENSSASLAFEDGVCLNYLYKSYYESHRRRNPDRIEGTLEWFLLHRVYRTWLEEQQSSFLWVSADPGCGKSVLASFLVDELQAYRPNNSQATTVCFFFCKDDNEEQNSGTLALCALLHQLFSSNPALIKYAREIFRQKGQGFTNEFFTLWRIFVEATTDQSCGNVFCIIDGLDECEEHTQRLLISSLEGFYKASGKANRSKSFVKFLVTSRPYDSIETGFHDLLHDNSLRDLPTIRLKAEDETKAISGDIQLVIQARVKKIASRKRLTDSRRDTLETNLINKSDRTFLWVSLILDMLEKSLKGSKKEFDDIIDNLPPDLNAIYNKLLQRSRNPAEVNKTLHIIMAAVRPLSVTELNIALALAPGHESIEDLDDLPTNEDYVKDLCGLFVRIISKKIYFVHQTAREYLVSNSIKRESDEIWSHSLYPHESHCILARICLIYLLFTVFESHPLFIKNEPAQAHHGGAEILRYTALHVFLEYAAKNWSIHFRNDTADGFMIDTALKLCNTSSNRWRTWFQVYHDRAIDFESKYTDLMVACSLGLDHLVMSIVQDGASVNERNYIGQTALHFAAQNSPANIVLFLLKHGARAAIQDDGDSTALHVAAERGSQEIVSLLIAHSQERSKLIRAKNDMGATALHLAAARGSLQILQQLVDASVDKAKLLAERDLRRLTAQRHAEIGGHTSAAQMLQKYSSQYPCIDNGKEEALDEGSIYGSEAVTRYLRSQKAPASPDADSSEKNATTAINPSAGGIFKSGRLTMKNLEDHYAASERGSISNHPLSQAAKSTSSGANLDGASTTAALDPEIASNSDFVGSDRDMLEDVSIQSFSPVPPETPMREEVPQHDDINT